MIHGIVLSAPPVLHGRVGDRFDVYAEWQPALAQVRYVMPPPCAGPTIARISGGIEVDAGHRRMRVTALTDDIVRVSVRRDGVWPENASWAVPAAVRTQHVEVTFTADGFQTHQIRVRIAGCRSPRDRGSTGTVISADADAYDN
jgi:hypothetical protein